MSNRCSGWVHSKCYCHPSLDPLMMATDTLLLGNFNTHDLSWYSCSTDSRGTILESMVSGSYFGILNWNSTTN